MKKQMMIITLYSPMLLLSVASTGFYNDSYIETMEKNIEELYKASDIPQLRRVVNAFERIAEEEKMKWEPSYYVAFGYLMMANHEENGVQKDVYLDRALKAVDKAKSLAPEESEIVALEGFVYMIRVTVDPASRGPEFAPMAIQTFGKAISLNPDNPRALVLSARMQYGTAQFFGASIKEACGIVVKSLEKFQTYRSENPLAPIWGKPMAESLMQQCK